MITALRQGWNALGRTLVLRARAVSRIGVALLVGYFCLTGWLGIDFGTHWDEWYQSAGLLKCVKRMLLLPQDFIYNGMYFLLGMPLLLVHLARYFPAIAREISTRDPSLSLDLGALASVKTLQEDATKLLAGKAYLVEARTLFLCLSALSIIWVYLTVLRLCPRRYLAALGGAAFLALSWEFQYHARILAIDAPLAQFLALEFLLFCSAWRAVDAPRFALWSVATGFVGGMVFACKTTGIFALLPVVSMPLIRREVWLRRPRVALVAAGASAFFVAAFLFSPASFLDPIHYVETMRYVARDYNSLASPSRPHYVSGLIEHIWRLGAWFGGAVPSPTLLFSIAGTTVATTGLVVLFRRHPRMMGTWGLFVAVSLACIAQSRLMIVRQYLMFVPLMAVAFGVGITSLRFKIRRATVRSALVVVLIVGFGLNERWLLTAALSVRTTSADTIKAELWRDIRSAMRPIRLSKTVHDLLVPDIDSLYRCDKADLQDRAISTVVMRFGDSGEIKANRLHGFDWVYSSHEANYDFYPTWIGNHSGDRILRIAVAALPDLGIQITTWVDCWPRTGRQ